MGSPKRKDSPVYVTSISKATLSKVDRQCDNKYVYAFIESEVIKDDHKYSRQLTVCAGMCSANELHNS